MSEIKDAPTRSSKPKLEHILRPQTQMELIFDVDLINDYIDVRNSVVMEVGAEEVIIAQSSPPVIKSMVGRSLEATFVRRDPVTSEVIRWGWRCQIKQFISNYKLSGDDVETIQALSLSLPLDGGLTETNARMDYRLEIGSENKIYVQTHPSFGRVTLFNFSAGGLLVGVPAPVQATVGMKLWFTLFFPTPNSPGQQTTINGEADVIRITAVPGESMALIGLKFLDLDLNATRTLQKNINYYMLEAQRTRNRENDI